MNSVAHHHFVKKEHAAYHRIFLSVVTLLSWYFSWGIKLTRDYCHHLGRLAPWLDAEGKSEQVIAVTGVRSVFPVRIFLADKTCFLKVLDGSPDGLFGDAEILGNPFYAWPCLAHNIPAVIQIDVDELRPMGKLVISIQLFEIGH